MDRKRIGLREVRALGSDDEVWDGTVSGFGARRQKGEAVSYVLMYRTREGRKRRVTIGRHGSPWTPEMARHEAQRILGEVVKGADPAAEKRKAREAMTVATLCDQYLADAEAGRLLTRRGQSKKASTLEIDKGRIERHIKPLLGRLAVAAVGRADVERANGTRSPTARPPDGIKTRRYGLARVKGGKGTATRAIGLLGGIFTYAVRKGVRPDNPVHGVVRDADGRRERRLSDDECAAFGDASEEGPRRKGRFGRQQSRWSGSSH